MIKVSNFQEQVKYQDFANGFIAKTVGKGNTSGMTCIETDISSVIISDCRNYIGIAPNDQKSELKNYLWYDIKICLLGNVEGLPLLHVPKSIKGKKAHENFQRAYRFEETR